MHTDLHAAPIAPTGRRSATSRPATIAEWLAIPEEQRAELIDGRIVYQGMPGPKHGTAQGNTYAAVSSLYGRRADGGRPGGWWLSIEVDTDLAGMGCRPDVLGWRRDRHAAMPEPNAQGVVTAAPDWICEVLSTSTAPTDMGAKRVGYHRAHVEHYWLLDPLNGTLTVLRWTPEGYLVDRVAGRGDVVRAAPFDAVELDIADLLGDDREEPQPSAETTAEAPETL
ncbi:MAG: Uma2 family endonuclease [Byssovorax sp.]